MKKIILDLCGGTGAWSKPYKDASYSVVNVTLPEYDVLQASFTPDPDHEYLLLPAKNTIKNLNVKTKEVYGILAAPPCTEFSVAKGNRPRKYEQALTVVNACLRIIWKCKISGGLKFWALENPRGLLRQFLGVPPWGYEHWQFGHEQIKPTDIWGYYKKPTVIVRTKPAGLSEKFPNGRSNGRGWSSIKPPAEYKDMNLNRAAIRAITPAGFALAFFRANR